MRSPMNKLCLVIVSMLTVFCGAQCFAQTRFVVNVPVANMFSGPSADTDVVSQAIYSGMVAEIEERGEWLKVRTVEDDYEGWIRRAEVLPTSDNKPYASAGKVVEVRARVANLYREPDVTLHAPAVAVPFETRLEVLEIKADEDRWIQVRLPDGRTAWIQHGDVVLLAAAPVKAPAKKLSIPEMVTLSKQFLGLPYTWGGRSGYGYDCSGFVQMLMRQRGYYTPRDADVQAAWNGFAPVTVRDLRAGDALFFGHEGKITHTGMYIGGNRFIHATTHDYPVIQISVLNSYWRKLLVAQRRVKQ